jgi:ribose-phosphate pyrophosphokinase
MADWGLDLEKLKSELSPKHIVFPGRRAESFVKMLEEQYKSLRQKRIEKIKGIMEDPSITHEFHKNIDSHLEFLSDLGFGLCDREIKDHNDGEIFVQGGTNMRNTNVDVVHLIDDPNKDLMELFIMCDAIKRAGAEKINIFMPYIPYQREDKKDEGKVAISAKLIFDLIKASCEEKLSRIVTYDLHAGQEQGFTNAPLDHLKATYLFATYFLSKHFKETYKKSIEDFVIVAPDTNATKRAEKLAKLLNIDFDHIYKIREGHGNAKALSLAKKIVEGKDVIIFDDMCDTGGTIVEGAEMCRANGAIDVFGAFTHGRFSKKINEAGIEVYAERTLRDSGVKVIVTDTIPRTPDYYSDNKDWLVDVISVTNPMGFAMLANRLGVSISAMIARTEKKIMDASKTRTLFEEEDIKPFLYNA